MWNEVRKVLGTGSCRALETLLACGWELLDGSEQEMA